MFSGQGLREHVSNGESLLSSQWDFVSLKKRDYFETCLQKKYLTLELLEIYSCVCP